MQNIEDTPFAQLQIPQEKINGYISNNGTNLVKGSCLGFIIKNDQIGTSIFSKA